MIHISSCVSLSSTRHTMSLDAYNVSQFQENYIIFEHPDSRVRIVDSKATQDVPKKAPDGPEMVQSGPRWNPDGGQMGPDGPKMGQDSAKMGPRRAKMAPESAPDRLSWAIRSHPEKP